MRVGRSLLMNWASFWESFSRNRSKSSKRLWKGRSLRFLRLEMAQALTDSSEGSILRMTDHCSFNYNLLLNQIRWRNRRRIRLWMLWDQNLKIRRWKAHQSYEVIWSWCFKSVSSIGKGEVEKPKIKPLPNDLKLLINELVLMYLLRPI